MFVAFYVLKTRGTTLNCIIMIAIALISVDVIAASALEPPSSSLPSFVVAAAVRRRRLGTRAAVVEPTFVLANSFVN